MKFLLTNEKIVDIVNSVNVVVIFKIGRFNSKVCKERVGLKDIVAISYARLDQEYIEKIIGFANFLRDCGYEAVMDEILKQQETAIDFNEMMAKMIPNAKKVIVVLSFIYKKRADNFAGGVGSEYRIILDEISRLPKKYIFVTYEQLEKVSTKDLLPSALGNREIIGIDEYDEAWQEKLFSKLSDEPIYEFREVAESKCIPRRKVIGFAERKSNINKQDIFKECKILMAENKQLLMQYGPDSLLAKRNPLSDAVEIWKQKKKDLIIPNNHKIIKLFEDNYRLFSDLEIIYFERFKAHADAFEMNQGNRLDPNAVPQFPQEFEQIIYKENSND